MPDRHECFFSLKHFTDNTSENDNESGFMGFTHALSAVAVCFAVISFFPNILTSTVGVDNLSLLVLIVLIIAGGALVPDLDNEHSTAESALGFFGSLISKTFRATSIILQTTIRTRRDDQKPNPHRGAWHVPAFCAILATLVSLGTQIGGSFSFPFYGQISGGKLFSIIFSFLIIHIAFSGLFKNALKSIKNSSFFGEIIALGISALTSFVLLYYVPDSKGLLWLPVSFFIGMLIHEIGDAFTTYGCPLLAPLPIKGKIWYNVRFPPHIKAGGVIENVLFIPFFSIVIVISIIKLYLTIFS